jgi:hypothetical protein
MAINKRIISGEPAADYGFAITRYTGNASNGHQIQVGFQPDIVFIHNIDSNDDWALLDSNRGSNVVYPNKYNGQDSFGFGFHSNGFTVNAPSGMTNGNGVDYVAYCFKVNAGTTSTGSGSGTSNIITQVNDDWGVGMASFTEAGASSSSVNHDASGTPEWILSKRTGPQAQNWFGQHVNRGGTKNLQINTNAVENSNSNHWNNTAADSTKITLGRYQSELDAYGSTICQRTIWHWRDISGYMRIGHYTGTGGTQTQRTGFTPKFVMIKATGLTQNWMIYDATLGTTQSYGYSVSQAHHFNSTAVPSSAPTIQFRDDKNNPNDPEFGRFLIMSSDSRVNQWGQNYIWWAIGGDGALISQNT